MQKAKFSQFTRLLICFLMLSSVAILRDARFCGHEIAEQSTETDLSPITLQKDGSIVVSTQSIASDVKGYGGPVPLVLTVKDGIITDIQALKNSETPDFFKKVENEIFPKWKGKTITKALSSDIDAVSGATLSSDAVNTNIRRAVQTVASMPAEQTNHASPFGSCKSVKWIIALIVVLSGAILPLFYKHKRYRIVQLCFNVIVLGFWSGNFLSYSLIVNYLSNGIDILQSIIPLLLLVTAFVFPFFGKKSHYCMWICPLGSLQELAGKCIKRKWSLSFKTLNCLRKFNEGLWALLMLLMWSGICFSWMDYELFSAFLLSQASTFVIVITILFIVLSLFVQRPYCRFVCPTGCLFRIIQNNNK